MNKKRKVKIGVEIELNSTFGVEVDYSRWELDSEHCGYELRSAPCETPNQIRGLIKSIKKMGSKAATTFENTGTHIHIDFLNDSNISSKDLVRLQVPKIDGKWKNPLGTGKRYVWVSESNEMFAAPKEYLTKKSPYIRPGNAYVSPGPHVEAAKRFFLIGKRFSSVLFALQHSSRRFNKYCHSISGWNEENLIAAKTISDICLHKNLQQNHRRHMFNALSFPKFGTIEVRMIKGSLDHKEIWEQIYLFGKIAQLAKGDHQIPKSTGDIKVDFILLMSACGIHGKMRRKINDRLSGKDSSWVATCFSCQGRKYIQDFYDYGLSRPICLPCHTMYEYCAWCGYVSRRNRKRLIHIDKKMPNGRGICNSCYDLGAKITMRGAEKDGTLYIMGLPVGSGTDKKGPIALREMRETFNQTKAPTYKETKRK